MGDSGPRLQDDHRARSRDRAQSRGPLLVAALAMIVYGLCFGHGYTLDDNAALLRNPVVTGDVGLMEVWIREFWGRPISDLDWSSSYRPLTTLSFALEHRWTQDPWLHHGVNVMLYAALCAQLTWVAARYASPRIGFWTGALFAVAPVHVENVASIVGRADVLAASAGLLAFTLLMPVSAGPSSRSRPSRRRSLGNFLPSPSFRAIAGGLIYLGGMLCKESIALLPGIILGWAILLTLAGPRGRDPGQLRTTWASALFLAGCGVAYLLARDHWLSVDLPDHFVGADNPLASLNTLPRVGASLMILGRYVRLTVVPAHLCSDHTYGDIVPSGFFSGLNDVDSWLGMLVALALACATVWATLSARREGMSLKTIALGMWASAFIAYALIGHWIIPISVVLAERLMCWPTVWVALASAASIRCLIERYPGHHARGAILGAVVMVYGSRSMVRSWDWRDSLALHTSSASHCPSAVHNRIALAKVQSEVGQHAEALWNFALAGALRTSFPQPPPSLPAFDAEIDGMSIHERLTNLRVLLAIETTGEWERFLIGMNSFLRQEDWLGARDVYLRYADTWDLPEHTPWATSTSDPQRPNSRL